MESTYYDVIGSKALINLMTLSKNRGEFDMFEYDDKNPEHRWLLHIAIMSSQVHSFPICIEAGFFTRMKLSWKYRKALGGKRLKTPKTFRSYDFDLGMVYPTTQEQLDFLREGAKADNNEEDFSFANILREWGVEK